MQKPEKTSESQPMSSKQNEKNVESGQQGTNEPWKEPGLFSNGRPRGNKDVVEKEMGKRKANEKKADS